MALKSALARPLNRWSYGDEDLSDLAAAYAFAIARNRPFVDGNKRSAFVLSLLFLARNGVQVDIPGDEAREAFLALSAGALSEDELAEWFRQRLAAKLTQLQVTSGGRLIRMASMLPPVLRPNSVPRS